MAKLDIVTLPDPLLRQISQPIEQVDDALLKLMDDMLETMYVAPGIGLAAIQVKVPKRLIVLDVGKEVLDVGTDEPDTGHDVLNSKIKRALDPPAQNMKAGATTPDDGGADLEGEEGAEEEPARAPNPICMVNPKILTLGDTTASYEEGCLSLPDVLVEIERPTSLTVSYIDRAGKSQLLEADGLLATVIQHEIDHLDGKLIIDFLSRLKRDIIVRKFKKMKRGAASV